jgi:copper chaperone CopZ
MDFNSTVDLIIKDLNEAREIIEDLKKYPGVPAIQVELAKSKCKSAADVIALLKTLKEKVEGVEKVERAEGIQKAEPLKVADFPEEVPMKKVPEKKQATSKTVKETEKETGIRTEKKKTESAIIADTFSHLPTSLNEQLGSTREEGDVTGNIKTRPVTNLSEAIGVNDKFLFIREIFNGSPESYEQAIAGLEGASNFSEAREMILSRTGLQKETEVVRHLLTLVKRKFPADE